MIVTQGYAPRRSSNEHGQARSHTAWSDPGLIHPGLRRGLVQRYVMRMAIHPLMGAGLARTPADVPRQSQDRGTETAQGEAENENPAHHPAADDSRRWGPVSTADLHDAVP
jgi:hypothetical protein